MEKRPQGANKKKKKYELKFWDIKFLKALNHIINENKKAGVEPQGVREISELIFGNYNTISKIRGSGAGINMGQLMKFATMFGLDYNYFFRDDKELTYDPNRNKTARANDGNHIQTSGGDIHGDIIKADVYKTGDVHKYIQRAKNIVNNYPLEIKQQFSEVIEDLQRETKKMETTIKDEAEYIKKISESYEIQMRDLRNQLKEKSDSENEIMRKYITLLEQMTKK
ncbi:MAG: hypothetical protein MI921_24895 [Cytophagales bacterium]|nr:hypothetical protein [Cytophagales bacterium]